MKKIITAIIFVAVAMFAMNFNVEVKITQKAAMACQSGREGC
jgi:hypothetical protein